MNHKTKLKGQFVKAGFLKLQECLLLGRVSDGIKTWEEDLSVTEEWILSLTATPKKANNQPTRFPMTPADVSRARKRTKVETIVESAEEDGDDVLKPSVSIQPMRRGSRAASKIANMRMKEADLNTKLRRPSHFNSKEPSVNKSTRVFFTEAPPSKRPRQGQSNLPNDDTSSATAESSFASARDSVTSLLSTKTEGNPIAKKLKMGIYDDVLPESSEGSKISTLKLTKKSSLRVMTVTEMETGRKTVTTQQTKTVIESHASKISTRLEKSGDMFASDTEDSSCNDDNIPLIRLAAKLSKNKNTNPIVEQEPIEAKSNTASAKKSTRSYVTTVVEKTSSNITAINGLVPVIELEPVDGELAQSVANTHNKIPDTLGSKSNMKEHLETEIAPTRTSDKTVDLQMQPPPPVITKKPVVAKTAIAEESMTEKKTVNMSKPKALNNATNRNNATPEALRNAINRNFEPGSVKKRVEELEKNLIVEPAVPAKLEMPVRITRTKAKALLANKLSVVLPLPEKIPQKVEISHLQKLARKSLIRAKKISVAKDRREVDLQKSLEKENTPPPTTAKRRVPKSTNSTCNKNKSTPYSYVHPSRLAAQLSTAKQPMSTSNIVSSVNSFLTTTKVVTAAEEAEEKRKEERRHRRENKEDALLKKKAIMDDKIEQQKRKREEKEKNVLMQRALLEREKAEMQSRVERENEEKARLLQEREEALKKEIVRKKEEAKQKAARIEERRVRKEAERIQALKLQEEEQLRLQAQKKKEQEEAERQHMKRMQEEKEKEKKEKEEAALREARERQEKLKQGKKIKPTPVLDGTFVVDKPVAAPRPPLVAASKDNYPLLDLTKGNDSDFSEGEDDIIPEWASRVEILKALKTLAHIPLKAKNIFFDCKPTTPDLADIFPNKRHKHQRSSSAVWRSPPRCSMLPTGF